MEELKNLISGLTPLTGLIDFYLEEVEKLEKRDTIFIICDLDDTLMSREKLGQEEELLKQNRGQEGNKVIINHFGMSSIIERFYENQNPPQDIVDIMKNNVDNLILTAGVPEYQNMKARAGDLTQFPIRVVYKGEDKVLRTMQYVLFELKYIPAEIIVYEDRPEYFTQYRELIEKTLGTKLTIMKVEMDGNDGYKSIEEV